MSKLISYIIVHSAMRMTSHKNKERKDDLSPDADAAWCINKFKNLGVIGHDD